MLSVKYRAFFSVFKNVYVYLIISFKRHDSTTLFIRCVIRNEISFKTVLTIK